MAFLLAFLAACAFALGSVLQQKGTVETSAGARDPRFLVQILRRPVWLAGLGLQVAGWVLQAFALKQGALMVVQSVTSLSLVVALPLGAKITDQRISRRVLIGAVAMVAGIVVFLLAGSPQGGTSQPDAAASWAAILATVVVIGLLAGFGRYRTGAARALLLGSAAGVLFALQAAVTKVFMTQLGHGVTALLGNWTTYALIVSAIAGFVIQQSALRTDVLAPAMASSNAVTLFASVVFGLTVFGETLSHGHGRLAPAIIGLILALAGIILLAGAKPPRAHQAHPAIAHAPASTSPPARQGLCRLFMTSLPDVADLVADMRGLGLSVLGRAAPLLASALRASPVPFVLMLDDLHELQSPACHDVLGIVISGIPPGSQLAAASRSEQPHLPQLRASGEALEFGAGDLALDVSGARWRADRVCRRRRQ